MKRLKWIDRRFTFDCPTGWMPNIIERLLGTPVLIQTIVAGIKEENASRSFDGGWSIKQHIGHLSDLEDLHTGRLEDLREKKKVMRPADMTNTKTRQANHNDRSLDHLISEFSKHRDHFVAALSALDPETLEFYSEHPRLKTRMRAVDLAFFVAEHDDHHLATIREIKMATG